MPLRVEGARVSLGAGQSAPGRRSRGLADIAPQYVAKSGLCTESELEGARGTSYRIQHLLGANSTAAEGTSRFPKLDECAHFHYEHVDLGPIQISLVEEDMVKPLLADKESVKHWYMRVASQGNTWMVRRSYENFRMLDEQLHRCIYDRKFSCLVELPAQAQDDVEEVLGKYLERLSNIAGNVINCGPVLNWLEMDNRGHRLLVPDTDTCPINTPAVAAAYSVKKYNAQAPDELSFEVGDMISVIDMPPPEESIWWRGKRGFLVGFFPCECVSVIGDKVPRNIRLNSSASEPSKSVLRKHGKLIAFFRSFILSRPSRRRLKQSGILKERVFGCDLGEHLQNSGHEIPLVLKCCAEFIETHGIVDGIYRLSGVTSNIHKLRNAFDEDRVPALYEDDAILQDIHSVASLLKMYFRELPNPLCTYQLYHQFVAAVQGSHSEDLRLLKMRDVVRKLPPPHYRTLEYLMRHLSKVAERGSDTGMTPRNVAIVWAPNLLRCREFEIGGVAALQFVGVQAVVTEFLVRYVDLIFTDKFAAVTMCNQPGANRKSRPKSLAISTPTKLLSLEEARNRALLNQQENNQQYIDVGGGPASLPPRYHTVIELPRKRAGSKRSPLGWRMLFGSRSNKGVNSHQRKSSTPADFGLMREKAVTEADLQSNSSKRRLRPAKSVESLSSTGDSSGLITSPRQPTVSVCLGPPDTSASHNSHNRSVSHESYFDTLQDDADDQVFESSLDISEIQVNFDLEESEMRIFSEDETLVGSGSLSFGSPRPKKLYKSLPLTKRITAARLAAEDSFSSSQSADPSPKKQKTQEEPAAKSKLEERLSSSAGELQFIDSVSPDQISVEAEVHLIQSPSPVSSLSRISSLLPPTSPILPHIPHLNQSRYSMPETPPIAHRNIQSRLSMPETPPPAHRNIQSRFSMPETPPPTHITIQSRSSTSETHSELTTPDTPYLQVASDSQSTLTTPDTPLCSTYTPLIESPEPPKPEERRQKPYHPYENVAPFVKTILETSFDVTEAPTDINKSSNTTSLPKVEECKNIHIYDRDLWTENEAHKNNDNYFAKSNAGGDFTMQDPFSDNVEAPTSDKINKSNHFDTTESDSYTMDENIGNFSAFEALKPEDTICEVPNSYGNKTEETPCNRDSTGSVKYVVISTESSCDSLIDFKKENLLVVDSITAHQVQEEVQILQAGNQNEFSLMEPSQVSDNNSLPLEDMDIGIGDDQDDFFVEKKNKVDSCELEGIANNRLVVDFKTEVQKGSFESSEENLSGVANMFEDPKASSHGDSTSFRQSWEKWEKFELFGPSEGEIIGDADETAWASESDCPKDLHFGDGSMEADLTETDQSMPSDRRIVDTSASSEASDWTTVIPKDQSDCVIDSESLSEDTSISSSDSGRNVEVLVSTTEKENLPVENYRTKHNSPHKRVAGTSPIKQRPKEIQKPPRKGLEPKISLEKIKSYQIEAFDAPARSKMLDIDIVELERSPKLRSNRRDCSENKEKRGSSSESSPVQLALKERRSLVEDMDTDITWRTRVPTTEKSVHKNDIPEVLKVTARLNDNAGVHNRHSAPVDAALTRKNVDVSPKRAKSGAPSLSPRHCKDAVEWEVETPLRSNSSGNVRQLMHKFEGCEKSERPRTLERLSTKKTKELDIDLSDPERRERIERYKEKRRTYLREKYRSEIEAARKPPFEKPPRKHPPPSSLSTAPPTATRRSFDTPTASSLRRSARKSTPSPTSLEKQRSPDFLTESKSSTVADNQQTSPRRSIASPSTPPYCIKDLAAMFEKRDATSSQVQHKQYLSSV